MNTPDEAGACAVMKDVDAKVESATSALRAIAAAAAVDGGTP
jgi:hypothetical protein